MGTGGGAAPPRSERRGEAVAPGCSAAPRHLAAGAAACAVRRRIPGPDGTATVGAPADGTARCGLLAPDLADGTKSAHQTRSRARARSAAPPAAPRAACAGIPDRRASLPRGLCPEGNPAGRGVAADEDWGLGPALFRRRTIAVCCWRKEARPSNLAPPSKLAAIRPNRESGFPAALGPRTRVAPNAFQTLQLPPPRTPSPPPPPPRASPAAAPRLLALGVRRRKRRGPPAALVL